MVSYFNRTLSQREMFWFFFFAVGLFVWPVIQADYLFLDDHSRTLLLGGGLWRRSGRIVAQIFYNFLSFTSVSPNVFPLAHVISIVMAAFALRALVTHYYKVCSIVTCLLVLPLFYTPTFLGILIYQYDGPVVIVGVAAVVFAVVYKSEWSVVGILAPAAIIAIAFSCYQIVFNVLLGLYCIEVSVQMARGDPTAAIVRSLLRRCVQVMSGLLIYYLTALQFLNTARTAMVPFDDGWAAVMLMRAGRVAEKISLFVNDGNGWLWIMIVMGAFIGYSQGVLTIVRRQEPLANKAVLVAMHLLLIPLMAITVPGISLLFLDFNPNAKLLLGLGPVLVAMLMLNHKVLMAVDRRAVWVLVLPVLAMLSFSYMFGRVLSAHKELESSMLSSLSYDISSRQELRDLNFIHLVAAENTGFWLPASYDVLKAVPALAYVGGESYLVTPEQFPRVGLTNVKGMDLNDFKRLAGKQQLIDNRFYDIYLSGDDAYIQLKQPAYAEGTKYRW